MLDHLGALLLMYPRGRQFADDFPALPTAIRGHFAEGTTPASAALAIASDILAGLLRQLGEAEKKALLAVLPAADPAETKALAARRLGRDKTRTSDPAAFATELARVAIFMARRMAEDGTLRREEFRHLLEAIERALDAEGTPLIDAFARQDDTCK